jgi:hypothetical protein
VIAKTSWIAPTLLLAGCIISQPKIDLQQTQLMPEEVARRIVAKYTNAAWAARPVLLKREYCPEPRATQARYSEITNAYYDSVYRRVWISDDGKRSMFGCPKDVERYALITVRDENEARELANALASLGAKLK